MDSLKEAVESVAVDYAKSLKVADISVGDANVLETLARASKGLGSDKQVILSRKTVKAFNKLNRQAALRELGFVSDIAAKFNGSSSSKPV